MPVKHSGHRFSFRFRLIPFIATVLVIALGISLAQWQTRRGDQKQALATAMQQRAAQAPLQLDAQTSISAEQANQTEFRQISVKGEFVADWPIYLDNRSYQGRPGFYVLMPFKIANSGSYLLVERGWLPLNPQARATLLPYSTPAGQIALQGVARLHPGRVMQLGQPAVLQPKAIVQNLDVAELARTSKLPFQPVIIEQTNDTQDGLIRDWPSPSLGIEKHRGYEFQWYALAVMAFLFFVVTGFKSGTKMGAKDNE